MGLDIVGRHGRHLVGERNWGIIFICMEFGVVYGVLVVDWINFPTLFSKEGCHCQ